MRSGQGRYFRTVRDSIAYKQENTRSVSGDGLRIYG